MTQKQIAEDIQTAVQTIRQGGIILYPTDTIWGIGCDASNEEAVKRIFQLKRREDSKAMICLVDSADRMQRYLRRVPDVAWDLVEFAEKPLTLILDPFRIAFAFAFVAALIVSLFPSPLPRFRIPA